jgi:uncharacterized damage-inducible protein DinB
MMIKEAPSAHGHNINGYTATKEYFIELADYINWADHTVIEWLTQINDEQWNRPAISSFESIKHTVIHMVSAKKIWVDTWTNAPAPVYLSKVFNGTKNELLNVWKNTSAELKSFIENYSETNYTNEIVIVKPNGETGKMEFRKTFPHMVNHATYHRGQLVTLLRQAGFTAFSNTDLFTYFSENGA